MPATDTINGTIEYEPAATNTMYEKKATIKPPAMMRGGVNRRDHAGLEVARAESKRPTDIEPKYSDTSSAPVSVVVLTGAMLAKVAIQSPMMCSMPAYMK